VVIVGIGDGSERRETGDEGGNEDPGHELLHAVSFSDAPDEPGLLSAIR
jgi:hypothetical protein